MSATETSRAVKATNLAEFLIREAKFAGDDSSRQAAAHAAIARIDTWVEADWAEAARLAGVRLPSAETRLVVRDMLTANTNLPADPFAGLGF